MYSWQLRGSEQRSVVIALLIFQQVSVWSPLHHSFRAAVKGKTELGLQHDVKSFVMRGMQISSLHILIF